MRSHKGKVLVLAVVLVGFACRKMEVFRKKQVRGQIIE